ncbi:MAG: phosphodiester glycosidase family protein [Clostridia bacterium]
MKKTLKIIGLFLLFQIIYIPIISVLLVYYGPFTNTRDMIVTTAMTTMKHQYFATWFFDNETIQEILKKNRPKEDLGNQNINDIHINTNISAQNPTDGVELVDVSSSTFKGYLLIVKDPSRVKLAAAPRLGVVGATTSQIIEANDAIGGINAGGFKDDALGTGGKADGVVIIDGKLVTDEPYGTFKAVGLDKDNKMIVSNSMTYSQIKKLDLKSVVSFGPVIIINGQPTIRSGDGGWGIQPRSAIAQKKDGTILMLVIDGRQPGRSIGATLKNVQDILLQYGAYNAFNLDGGASSTMVFDSKLINKPSDILGERYVPCAFIITKPDNIKNFEKK